MTYKRRIQIYVQTYDKNSVHCCGREVRDLPRFYELDYQEPGCRRSTNELLREVL